MKLLNCVAENFGSYKHLEFSFDSLGLSLIYGATGAGKSTLMDIPCWTIYGVTAKDGNADEVRAWNHEGSPTSVSLKIQLPTKTITVTRIRGRSTQNDLFWTEEGSDTPIRGKDIIDTQKLLVEQLGITEEAYTTCFYFHEFSKCQGFFTAKAPTRKLLFDQLASLDFAKTLQAACQTKGKVIDTQVTELKTELTTLSGKISGLKDVKEQLLRRAEDWEKKRVENLRQYAQKKKNFDYEQQQAIRSKKAQIDAHERDKRSQLEKLVNEIKDLENSLKRTRENIAAVREMAAQMSCPICSSVPAEFSNELEKLVVEEQRTSGIIGEKQRSLDRINSQENPHFAILEQIKQKTNNYDEYIQKIEREVNPFSNEHIKMTRETAKLKQARTKKEQDLVSFEVQKGSISQIKDFIESFKILLLENTIRTVELRTNELLDKYFESELKVIFSLESADSINVSISKSGNQCTYKQLSKGQRQLLKLCFSVSVMEAAERNLGINVQNVFMDEPLDGLDSDFKVKSFALFQEISTKKSSVLVIDHNDELKNLFDTKFKVKLSSDTSEVHSESV